MIAFYNDRFMPMDQINISPDDRGFLFADGVYEVIRSYNGKLFRAEDHLERLHRSMRELKIKRPVDIDFIDICQRLLSDNGMSDKEAFVYIQITRGVAPRHHPFPVPQPRPTIYAFASEFEPPADQWENGAKAVLVPDIRWARCDIKTVSLLPNVLGNQEAEEKQAVESVFVRDGAITEGSHTNFCAVFDGQLVTAPLSHYILPGITRKVVLEMCGSLNIPVREFPILQSELDHADECMIVGTITELIPVIQINEMIVGNGRPGTITRRLQKAFQEITRGK